MSQKQSAAHYKVVAERAGAAPVVAQPRRVDRVAVGKYGGACRGAVADIGVGAGAVLSAINVHQY